MSDEQQIREDVFPSDEEFDDEKEDDSESSTDVDAKIAEEEVFDVEFLKCYSALKKKNEKIYDKNVRFFTNDGSSSDSSDEAGEEIQNQRERKIRNKFDAPRMTLLDAQLKQAEADDDELVQPKIDLNQEVSKSYYEKELQEIKKSIEEVGEGIDSDSDDDLLVVKGSDNQESKDQPQKRNKIQRILDKIEDDDDEDIRHLKQVWTEPEQLSDEDKYLRDYILNKRYLQAGHDDEDGDDGGFFSKNLDQMSDADDSADETSKVKAVNSTLHHSDEKNFDKIVRIPRNSTKTIRDMVEKQEKKDKRLKRLKKEKKKKLALKDADCEDILGDLPTKFHYRQTEPNDFGLTAEELLMATDEELDKWVSLHECVAYKSKEAELAQKKLYESKRNDMELKRKVFRSIYGGAGDQTEVTQKKEHTSKRKRSDSASQSIEANIETEVVNPPQLEELSERRKKKKKRIRGIKQKKFASVGVAPDRLLAYGLSKTKLKREKLL